MRILIADDHPLYREAAALQIQRLYREAHIKEVASLDELRAKLIGLLQAPAGRIVGVLQAPGGQVARVLGAYAKKAGQTA